MNMTISLTKESLRGHVTLEVCPTIIFLQPPRYADKDGVENRTEQKHSRYDDNIRPPSACPKTHVPRRPSWKSCRLSRSCLGSTCRGSSARKEGCCESVCRGYESCTKGGCERRFLGYASGKTAAKRRRWPRRELGFRTVGWRLRREYDAQLDVDEKCRVC